MFNRLRCFHDLSIGHKITSKMMSTAFKSISTKKISSSLELRTVNGHPEPKEKSLVVLMTWLYGSESAVSKYCNLYHNRGLDVLRVSSHAKHFLWPSLGVNIARELLDYLAMEERDSFLVHAMSIGAFVYTTVLMQMIEQHAKYGNVRRRIHGHVFDSVTMGSLKEMATGVSQRGSNQVMKSLISGGTNTYFFLTYPFTVKFYDKAVAFFKEQPLYVPTLIFSSLDDPMCNAQAMREMVQLWQGMGLNLEHVFWKNSSHAGHLVKHPEEYTQALDKLIDTFLEQHKIVSPKL